MVFYYFFFFHGIKFLGWWERKLHIINHISPPPPNSYKDQNFVANKVSVYFTNSCWFCCFTMIILVSQILDQGVKLSLQSQISSHWTEPGGFIVLAPFKKKDQQQTLKPNKTAATTSNVPTQCSASRFANSARSNISSKNRPTNIEFKNMNVEDRRNKVNARPLGTRSSETKCKSGFRGDKQEGVFVKKGSTTAKRARGNCSVPSCTCSFEAHCHVRVSNLYLSSCTGYHMPTNSAMT